MRHVTFLGDSITSDVTRAGCVNLMFSRLDYRYSTTALTPASVPLGTGLGRVFTGGEYTFYNAGLGSDSTAMMRTRFLIDVLGHHSDDLYILGGVNDIGELRPVADIMADLQWMVEQARANGIAPHLGTLTPYNGGTTTMKDMIDALNALIRAYCTSAAVPLNDFWKAMEWPIGGRVSPYLLPDNLHPSAAGYVVMAAATDTTGWPVYAPIAQPAEVAGLVDDWNVTASGTLLNTIGGAYAPITGNGGALPNARPANAVSAGMRGYVADLTLRTAQTIPTARWNKPAGAVVAVVGCDWGDALTHNIFQVPGTAGNVNRLQLDKVSDTLYASSWGGDGVGVDCTVDQRVEGVRAAVGRMLVVGMSWGAVGTRAFNSYSGFSAATVASDVPVALSANANIGFRGGPSSFLDGPFHRLLVFNRELSVHEILSVANAIIGGTDTSTAMLAAIGNNATALANAATAATAHKAVSDAVRAKTDNLPAIPASKADADAATAAIAAKPVTPATDVSALATTAQLAVLASALPNPDTDVAVTPATLGTDGNALGHVPVGARVLASCGNWHRAVHAEADGDFTLYLPPGAIYELRADAPNYATTTAEVTV